MRILVIVSQWKNIKQSSEGVRKTYLDWLMNFHPNKCNVLRISTWTPPPYSFNYFMHNQRLESLDSAEYLGVTLQSDLKWNKHIQNSINKGYTTLGLIRWHLSWQA